MVKKKYDLLVFDWDGTLMDSTATIVKCLQSAAHDLGLAVPSVESASYVIGLGLADAMHTAIPDLEKKDYPRLVERYRHHYFNQDSQLVLFDGVKEMLEELSQSGYLLAVATGKSRAGLNRALTSSQLVSLFDATRCADETFSKPNPAMLLELTRELGQEINRTVMIGDTIHDLLMASNAGTDAVAVHYGAHSAEDLQALQPVYMASSVPLLHQWLRDNA